MFSIMLRYEGVSSMLLESCRCMKVGVFHAREQQRHEGVSFMML